MACAGCGNSFRDERARKGLPLGPHDVPRSTHHRLCYSCMLKALQVYECSPKELLQLYDRLREAGIHVPQEIIDDEVKEAEIRFADPHDIMFNPRVA